jgi:peptide deformylase
MAVKRIRLLGDEVLRSQSAAVADPSETGNIELAEDLRDTLMAFRRDHGYGRGIAAPQLGVTKRMIVIDAPGLGFSDVLVNPEVLQHGNEQIRVWDFCFSIPELVVQVDRYASIVAKYTDMNGKERTVEARGDLSELLQHEIDHLDGILMLDRAVTPRSVWSRAEWERQRHYS